MENLDAHIHLNSNSNIKKSLKLVNSPIYIQNFVSMLNDGGQQFLDLHFLSNAFKYNLSKCKSMDILVLVISMLIAISLFRSNNILFLIV